jgi:hypothetical protein
MRPQLRSLATAAAAFALFFAAAPANADPTSARECIAAADRGQAFQHQHKLLFAREALRICAAPACPTEVQRACIGWLDQADRAQPTLAFSVTDAAGTDLNDVRVTMDGEPFVAKVMGTAVELDPGAHIFRFVAPGYESLTRKVVIVEGEKTRQVHVILEKVGGPAHKPRSADDLPDAPTETTAPVEHSTTQKTAGIIVLAAGGASIGTGIGFLISFVINKTNLSQDMQNNYGQAKGVPGISNPCSFPGGTPNAQTNDGCAAQQNAQLAEDVMIATFIGGGVLSIVGISLMATAPSDRPPPGHVSWRHDLQLLPSVAPGRESLVLVGWF